MKLLPSFPVLRFVLLLLTVLATAACGNNDESASPSQQVMQSWVGKDFSALEVETLDGVKQPLRDAVMDKKPVILNIWATWCTPCLVEMPTLAALGKQGQYTVIAIATDKDTADVKDFLKKQTWGQGVQIWFDKLGRVTRDSMGARAIPVTYVLDTNLKVRMVEAGERDWSHPRMQAKIQKALSQ